MENHTFCVGIRTLSGFPWMSNEQRDYFNTLKKQAYDGLEPYMNDPEFKYLPFVRQYASFQNWRKYDVQRGYNQVHPFTLFMCNYKYFVQYIEKVEYEAKCSYAVNDISQEEFDQTLIEIEKRKLLVESEFDLSKKKEFKKLDINERKSIQQRIGQGIEKYIKDTFKPCKQGLHSENQDASVLV